MRASQKNIGTSNILVLCNKQKKSLVKKTACSLWIRQMICCGYCHWENVYFSKVKTITDTTAVIFCRYAEQQVISLRNYVALKVKAPFTPFACQCLKLDKDWVKMQNMQQLELKATVEHNTTQHNLFMWLNHNLRLCNFACWEVLGPVWDSSLAKSPALSQRHSA